MPPFIVQCCFLLLGSVLAIYFYSSLKIREIAVAAAKRHCQEMHIQLLDQSVSLKKIRFGLTPNKSPALLRSYIFEFTSTGDERYKGYINMISTHIININLQAHRIPEQPE